MGIGCNSILYNGFKPVFVDIDLNNLGANYENIKRSINKNTIAIFNSRSWF